MNWIATLRSNVAVLWTIGTIEARTDVRLLRTWFFFAFALLVGVTNTIEQVSVYTQLSAVSSGTFMHSPLLSPITIFPDFQVVITLGLIFFAIEINSRDRSAQIDEVIGALPLSNNQIVFGRALGLSALLFALFATFLCLYVATAYLCDIAVPSLGFRPPEPYSMLATLVLDALPYVYFWIATVMFLTVLVRFRVLAAVLAIALMLLMYWVQNNAPMYLLDVLGTYSLNTRLPSELSPTFTSSAVVYHRIALVLLATAFLYWTAYLLPRLNTVRTQRPIVVTGVATVLAVIGFSIVQVQTSSRLQQQDDWRARHAQFDTTPQIDVEHLSGRVEIAPGEGVAIDLTLEVALVQKLREDDRLLFSLNPGYEIEDLVLGGETGDFSFDHGLLAVTVPGEFEEGERLSLTIKASGQPNARFAYLDTAIDPFKTDVVSGYGLFLLGSEAAINHSDYVALLPGVAWYPMAGPHLGRDARSHRPRDYFDVELEVLTPGEWRVGGPGRVDVADLPQTRSHTITPLIPLHEIGLFASIFERRTMTIGDIEFELLVSPEHTRNLDLFKPIQDEIVADIDERLEFARTRGFKFPFDVYTIVETPTYLRTFGGGWQMASAQSLPGMYLLREGMFLSADFQAVADSLDSDNELAETEKRQRLLGYLSRYFDNDVTGGNILHAFADNFVRFRTEPTGPGTEWLSFLINYLAIEVVSQSSGFYSVQNLKTIGKWATARWGSANIDAERTHATLNEVYFNEYINRPEVWEFMLNGTGRGGEEASSARNRLHAGYLYSQTMGDLLLDWYGQERITAWLTTLTERFQGTTFTYDDVNQLAAELDLDLQGNFGDWLHDLRPAGFLASTYTVERLPDSSEFEPVYENTFHVQNREPSHGLLSVLYETSGSGADATLVFRQITRPIRVNGNSSVQIAIHTQKPIERMTVQPYFSLNRANFEVDFEGDPNPKTVVRDSAPMVQSSDWVWDFDDKIYVDDLEPGFTIDPPDDDGDFRFTVRMVSFSQPDPELVIRDSGLEMYTGLSVTRGNNWRRQTIDTSFGAYRRTLVRAEHDSTAQRVHFSANLTRAGTWSLYYHLPDVRMKSNSGVFRDPVQYVFRLGESTTWGDFDVSVTQADAVHDVRIQGVDMPAGWNRIGTFELHAEDVTVSVSTQSANGTIVADAIYWEYDELAEHESE